MQVPNCILLSKCLATFLPLDLTGLFFLKPKSTKVIPPQKQITPSKGKKQAIRMKNKLLFFVSQNFEIMFRLAFSVVCEFLSFLFLFYLFFFFLSFSFLSFLFLFFFFFFLFVQKNVAAKFSIKGLHA